MSGESVEKQRPNVSQANLMLNVMWKKEKHTTCVIKIPLKHKATLNFKLNDFLLCSSLLITHNTQSHNRSRKVRTYRKINIRETSQATAGWLACACVVVLLSALLRSLRLHTKHNNKKLPYTEFHHFFRSRNTAEPVNLFCFRTEYMQSRTLYWRCVGSGDRVTETVRVSWRTDSNGISGASFRLLDYF